MGAGLWDGPRTYTRRERRRPPLEVPALYQLRIDIEGADPPIWRRILMWSDLTLADLHAIVQIVFGWHDAHLWRFSLGGDPFHKDSQVFLCPHDAEERDESERDSPMAMDVRIDETVQKLGDVVRYVYDYGDSWQLRIKLERTLEPDYTISAARLVGGRRAAPPEDCGGLRTADELAEVLDDPAFFDVSAVNEALEGPPYESLGDLPARLFELGLMLGDGVEGFDFAQRVKFVTANERALQEDEFASSTEAIQWFLDRAVDGLPLTSAGYLKPADVVAASEVLSVWRTYGKRNRESNVPEVLGLRIGLQEVGLLRSQGRKLLLTRAGEVARRDVDALRNHLIERLIPQRDGFDRDATLLFLLHAAVAREKVDVKELAHVLTLIGYRADGMQVRPWHILDLPVTNILCNLTTERNVRLSAHFPISDVASAIAQQALLHWGTKAAP